MSGADFHAQQELEAELYQERCLLLDEVARGMGTMETAHALARHLGIAYQPLRKPNPVPLWDGTCNAF